MKAAPVLSRIQLENILFATDFSPAATAALPFAAKFAQQFGGKLFAVHAKTPENHALPPTELWPAANVLLEENKVELTRNMYNRFPNVESEVLIGEGSVWSVVEAFAKQKKADLIVVGTSGRRGIGKFILGSVAEEILRRARCPVLTVGPNLSTEPPQETKFRKIVFATNFGEGSPLAAAYAVALAQEYGAHLILLHVVEYPKVGELVGPHELEAAALDHLRGLVPRDAELHREPKVMVLHGSPAERILETVENEKADLVVMGLREAKGIIRATRLPAAVAHQVISHAICPVLTIRA